MDQIGTRIFEFKVFFKSICISVLDFHPIEVLSPKEKEDIKEDSSSLKNLPNLLCTLRECIEKMNI